MRFENVATVLCFFGLIALWLINLVLGDNASASAYGSALLGCGLIVGYFDSGDE